MTNRASRFAAVYAVLTAAHEVADHWVQNDSQAAHKGDEGREGVKACLSHVATYTAVQGAALVAANRVLSLGVKPSRMVAALAVSAATHYYADRHGGHWRDEDPRGLVKLAHEHGKSGWLARDPNAGYLLDQSWHKGWIAAASVIAA